MIARRAKAVVLLVTILVAVPGVCVAAVQGRERLDNEAVVAMTKAGLSPTAIVSKIQTSGSAFDVSTEALIRLKQEGVADEVIEAMLAAANEPSEPGVDVAPQGSRLRRVTTPGLGSASPPEPFPADIGPNYAPGIYLLKQFPERWELVPVEPAVYTQAKASGAWKTALSRGVLKTHYKAVLPGAHADLQVDVPRPVFYFVFDVPNSSLSYSGSVWQGLATSANEFVLVKMEVKKSSREIVVGASSKYTGDETGTREADLLPFEYERVEPGVYKVTPKRALPHGEYCFYYGGVPSGHGARGAAKVFDFGVAAAARAAAAP
jgi:hypothetical protein